MKSSIGWGTSTQGDSRLDMFINLKDLPGELVLGAEDHTIAMGFDGQAVR